MTVVRVIDVVYSQLYTYLCNLCLEPEIFILSKTKRLSQRLNLIMKAHKQKYKPTKEYTCTNKSCIHDCISTLCCSYMAFSSK